MVDVVDRATRSRMMKGIRGKNTQPEILVRKALFARGLRFRLHDRSLPGRPDIVIKKHNAVVFVNGCFWHGHQGCRYFKLPGTNPDFWRDKIEGNRKRDLKKAGALTALGWRVAVVWECAVREDLDGCAQQLQKFIAGEASDFETAPVSG
ncbi:MAG TPA: very short patch repair endonuclease [Nevskia sp.]|nr:very short patch repair endonuclease [Nevskia sp.]